MDRSRFKITKDNGAIGTLLKRFDGLRSYIMKRPYLIVAAGVIGVVYWYYKRYANLKRKELEAKGIITPFESIPGQVVSTLPRPLQILVGRVMYLPTLYYNALWIRWGFTFNRNHKWWNTIDTKVILGALPFRNDIKKLYAEGVRSVINTCDEYEGPIDLYAKFGIQQLYIPCADYTSPTMEQIENALLFIQEQSSKGIIYVHCKAGRGRSATIVMCYLIATKKISAIQAQKELLTARSHASKQLYRRKVVMDFEKKIFSGKSV